MTCDTCQYWNRRRNAYPCQYCLRNQTDFRKDNWRTQEPDDSLASWNDIDTIPTTEFTEVRTVKGLIRVGKPRCGTRWFRRADKWGPKRVECFCKNGSNVWAIAWRPI